ncbi:UDP-glucose 4-epimerase [Caulifigura coniformis]|uniref:UDP-glucose 4-epimerase n=1 Tax=Caulifigura coniformis TaxID=2527983 RepID=A0A517SC79_9PLAN|nr:NAD-dependent epimerase/dehydratase family protein [Caulifigura coniformis]QDT53747.1 UDP-glucose 4-epimerase [Caulifigura coniformis]
MRKCLVTGGAGFIGSHLATRLVHEGWQVRILDNLSTGSMANFAHIEADVDFLEGDVADPVAASLAAKGMDVVFHQAALASVPLSLEKPLEVHRACATGTLTVLDAARGAGVSRVVYAASSSAYGDAPVSPKTEQMTPQALSPYAAAKLAGELYAESFAASLNLETVRLRYFNVFGPRQDPKSPYSAVIPLFASAMAAGRRPKIFGDGEQSRDFVYIDNVVQANIRAATTPGVSGRVFNVGSGESITVNQLLRAICERVGQPFDPEYLPPRAGDVLHSAADISATMRDLGYRPAPQQAGLEKTIDYYVELAGKPVATRT